MAKFFSRFYAPIIFGIIAIALAIFSPVLIPKNPSLELELGFSVGVLGLKMPLATWMENALVVRFIVFSIGVLLIIFALLTDFSKYFPQRLKVDVLFDQRGISRTLRQFSNIDLRDLQPKQSWESQIQKYDDGVVVALNLLWSQRQITDAPPIESIGREFLHATGETKLVVKRTSFLKYEITSGGGLINLKIESKNRTTFEFQSAFYLRTTGSNYLRPKIFELIKSPTIVLRPEFKQVFRIEHGGANAPFDHVLVALTKINLLPIPTFSDTLYLWKNEQDTYIPVGYAIYSSPDDTPETRGTSF